MAAASSHLADVMAAVRTRILTLSPLFQNLQVEIGNPAQFHPRSEATAPLVTLFVYRIEPDNAALLATPDTAVAVRLHTLITAFCPTGENNAESAGSMEMRLLSHIMRLFLERSSVGPVRIRGALPIGPLAALVASDLMIEARQLAPDMEEINHIWTTQADTPYRTSLVYKFSFGFVTPSRPSDEGPPVLNAVLGDRTDPTPHPPGPNPVMADAPEPAAVDYGVLAVNVGTGGATVLAPTASFRAGGPDPSLRLVAVTEKSETLALRLERFDAASGVWSDASASLHLAPASLTSAARSTLAIGGTPPAATVGFDNPGAPGVLRIVASRAAAPARLKIAPVMLVMEAAP